MSPRCVAGVDPRAVPRVLESVPGVVRVDAMHGFAPLAGEVGRPHLIAKARAKRARGPCHLELLPFLRALDRCRTAGGSRVRRARLHDRAAARRSAWRQAAAARHESDRFRLAAENAPPFAFDFATSVVARGEVELHAKAGKALPAGWAIDRNGEPTTDAVEALAGALLPFGGHKGAALSMMVELLAGALLAPPLRPVEESDADAGPRIGGEIVIAFDPAHFGESASGRAEALFAEWQSAGGGRLPSTRRYAARERSRREGVRIPVSLLNEIRSLSIRPPVERA